MNREELLLEIQKMLSNLIFYNAIEPDIHRLIGLVQENQSFFGDPPAGASCIKLATDKLEELIRQARLEAEIKKAAEILKESQLKLVNQALSSNPGFWAIHDERSEE